jgi:hypothetical protein
VENGRSPAAIMQTNEGSPSRQLSAVAFDEFPLWLETISRVAESVGLQIVGTTTVAEDAAEIVREERPNLFIVGLNRAADKREQACRLSSSRATPIPISSIIACRAGRSRTF